jgi:hypothetical protein
VSSAAGVPLRILEVFARSWGGAGEYEFSLTQGSDQLGVSHLAFPPVPETTVNFMEFHRKRSAQIRECCRRVAPRVVSGRVLRKVCTFALAYRLPLQFGCEVAPGGGMQAKLYLSAGPRRMHLLKAAQGILDSFGCPPEAAKECVPPEWHIDAFGFDLSGVPGVRIYSAVRATSRGLSSLGKYLRMCRGGFLSPLARRFLSHASQVKPKDVLLFFRIDAKGISSAKACFRFRKPLSFSLLRRCGRVPGGRGFSWLSSRAEELERQGFGISYFCAERSSCGIYFRHLTAVRRSS